MPSNNSNNLHLYVHISCLKNKTKELKQLPVGPYNCTWIELSLVQILKETGGRSDGTQLPVCYSLSQE